MSKPSIHWNILSYGINARVIDAELFSMSYEPNNHILKLSIKVGLAVIEATSSKYAMQFGFPHDDKLLPFIGSGPRATQSSAWPCSMENIQHCLGVFQWTGEKPMGHKCLLSVLWEAFIYHTWLKCLIPRVNECISTHKTQEGIIPTPHQKLKNTTFSLTMYFHLGVANREFMRDSNNSYEPKLRKVSEVWRLLFGKYSQVSSFLFLQ